MFSFIIKLFNVVHVVIQIPTLCVELGCMLIVNFEIIPIMYYIHYVLFFLTHNFCWLQLVLYQSIIVRYLLHDKYKIYWSWVMGHFMINNNMIVFKTCLMNIVLNLYMLIGLYQNQVLKSIINREIIKKSQL